MAFWRLPVVGMCFMNLFFPDSNLSVEDLFINVGCRSLLRITKIRRAVLYSTITVSVFQLAARHVEIQFLMIVSTVLRMSHYAHIVWGWTWLDTLSKFYILPKFNYFLLNICYFLGRGWSSQSRWQCLYFYYNALLVFAEIIHCKSE